MNLEYFKNIVLPQAWKGICAHPNDLLKRIFGKDAEYCWCKVNQYYRRTIFVVG